MNAPFTDDAIEVNRRTAEKHLADLNALEAVLPSLRQAYQMELASVHRRFTDDEIIQLADACHNASMAMVPVVGFLNHVRIMAIQESLTGGELGKRLVEVLGFKLAPLCPPGGHHPDCPEHADNLARRPKEPQARQDGFQQQKRGEA